MTIGIKIAYIGLYVKDGRFVWADGTAMRYQGPWVDKKKPTAQAGSCGIIYGSRWESNLAEWRTVKGSSSAVSHYICEWSK